MGGAARGGGLVEWVVSGAVTACCLLGMGVEEAGGRRKDQSDDAQHSGEKTEGARFGSGVAHSVFGCSRALMSSIERKQELSCGRAFDADDEGAYGVSDV